MKKTWMVAIGALAMIACLSIAGASLAAELGHQVREGSIRLMQQPESSFPSLAKITPDKAVAQALKTMQGQVLKTELENENDFLVYGVEVVTADKSIVDVKVDAGSGKVLAMNRDKADGEDHGNREREEDGERED